MRISVFGLGYVGTVSAACLAKQGHEVIGIDVNPQKVDSINSGRSPVIEPQIDAILAETVRAGLVRAAPDATEGVLHSDVSLVCVGTPGRSNGGLDLQHVERVCEQIGSALRGKSSYHLLMLRSTVLPGTTEDTVVPILQRTSGKLVGRAFGVVFNPEFLREGSSVEDFYHPSRTVIGQLDDTSGSMAASLYSHIDAPLVRTDVRTAEMVKYADNAFHALKIAFGNEIGAFCRLKGIDSHHLMDIFCLDTKLNISRTYLRPGNAFGGSCLPKDLRALTYAARADDLSVPLLEAILSSNEAHKRRAIDMIVGKGKGRIGVVGLSFKESTDDLRESPTVEMIEYLIGKGNTVHIYDPIVSLARLTGANKAFIERTLPHIVSLLVPRLEDLVGVSDLIVVTSPDPALASLQEVLRPGQILIDLPRTVPRRLLEGGNSYMTRSLANTVLLLENNSYPRDHRIRNEALALRDAGFTVSVIAPRDPGQAYRECLDGVHVYRFPGPPRGSGLIRYIVEYGYATLAILVVTLWVWLRHGLDIVHSANPPDTLFVVGALAKVFGKRYVFDHHDLAPETYQARFGKQNSDWVYRSLRWLETCSYRTADAVIATNGSYRRVAIERGGKKPEQVFVVRNGAKLGGKSLPPTEGRLPAERCAAYSIGYIGTMGPQDGVDYLLRAVYELVYTVKRRDFVAVIIGQGDALTDLQRLAADLRIQDYVWFTGFIPDADALRYLCACQVCVHPDPLNSLNNCSTMIKMLEYMALAKPVVAFDLREARCSAADAALYAAPNDVLDFARKIDWLLNHPAERARMGELSRRRYLEKLAWEYSVPNLLAAYASLGLQSRKTSTPRCGREYGGDVDDI